MAICQFFLQGRCRFGDRCWNEHPARGSGGGRHQPQQQPSGSNRRGCDASSQRRSGVIQPSSFSKSAPWGGSRDQEKSSGSFPLGDSASSSSREVVSENAFASLSADEQKDEKKLLEGIVKDMEVCESSGQWKFSVYSPMKDKPNISGTYCYEILDKDIQKLVLSFLDGIKENMGKFLEEFKKTIEEQNKEFSKELETLNKKQLEIPKLNNELTEIKSTLEESRSRMETMEGRLCELEDDDSEITQFEDQVEKNEQGIRALWDYTRRNNVRIIGIPEREERKRSLEDIFEEIVIENFPNLEHEMIIQDAQRDPNRLNVKRNAPRHIIIGLSRYKDKESLLRAARNKGNVTYKGASIRLSADFSPVTMQARRQWCDIYKTLKENNYQPEIIYPAKLSFKSEGEIRIFPDKEKLKEFVATRIALQQVLKGVL
ncbi:nucleoporin NUP42 isoform X1 [Tenrec ecaudatus]|uniref:nucleoporin NUP42 isoform X1 n=1 Tax=Tenrec ecaudatus TaxID=94439 RepID=UPI003F5A60AF